MPIPYEIADLASATTPLGGSELVEIVQSGVNRKVTTTELVALGGDFVLTTDARLADSRTPTGAPTGDLSGTYPNPTVAKVAGTTPGAFGLSLLATAVAGDATALLTLGGFDLLSTLNNAEVGITTTAILDSTALGKLHVISGTAAAYTITLPTAAGNAGKLIGFRVKEFALANRQYTVDGLSAEPIDGIASASVGLIHTNVLILISDGTGWRSLVKTLDTKWLAQATPRIRGTVSDPTRGTMVRDTMYWRRVGGSLEGRMEFHQSVAGTAGSGEFLIDVGPNVGGTPLFAIDLTADGAPANTVTYPGHYFSAVGTAHHGASNYQGSGPVAVYDAASVRFAFLIGNTVNTVHYSWGSSGGGLTVAPLYISANFSVPMVGW